MPEIIILWLHLHKKAIPPNNINQGWWSNILVIKCEKWKLKHTANVNDIYWGL